MAKQTINIGSTANDGTGSTLRVGGDIINDNFNEIYTAFGDGSTLTAPLTAAGTATLTNKTIDLGGTGNVITGSLAEFNTALQGDSFVSLTGSETLTNKTLTTPVIDTITRTGDFTIDASNDIILDADNNGTVAIKDGGTQIGSFFKTASTFSIKSDVQDKRLEIKGNDGGSEVPDSKSQVTMLYENGKPSKVTSLVISSQHKEGLSPSDVKEIVKPYVYESIPNELLEGLKDDEFYVNPTGNFVIGGPDGDSGLTGRKIIVDTYGGAAPHGGGAFSGKDPSKVDRSAAYASRYLAKNIVAANLADECTIQLSYAIGVSKPLSVYVNTNGTNKVDEQKIEKSVQDLFDLSPRGIREHLKLTNAIYVPTSAYGHFGREPTEQGHFTWEKTDLVDSLKNLL